MLSRQQKQSKPKDTRDTNQTQENLIKRWKDVLHDEMDNDKVRDFCEHANLEWREVIVKHYKNFHKLSDKLLSESTYVKWCGKMAIHFSVARETVARPRPSTVRVAEKPANMKIYLRGSRPWRTRDTQNE